MSAFVLNLLDFIILPFSWTSNLIIFVPTLCFTIVFVFSILKKVM